MENIERREAKTWTVFFRSDLRVVRTDPEYADLDNPRGEVLGEHWYAVAEDADGHRQVWGAAATEAEAREAYEFLAPPVSEDFWYWAEPAYGSRAYQLEDCEVYWAGREKEEDYAYAF